VASSADRIVVGYRVPSGQIAVGRAIIDACLICARGGDGANHEGSVGGNVYEDEHWYAYHAPPKTSAVGQLFLVSKRHVLDFSGMTPDEAASYGRVLGALFAALKQAVDAERVYLRVTIEGVPHFHTWIFPRPRDAAMRGTAFLNAVHSCTETDALAAVARIRATLACRTA
jgi:diadenosine tetraphosphate (Ap4A) HIT family hydrolase